MIELPPDESIPDCAFVEDTAIVCNGIALLTRPASSERGQEVDQIRSVFKKELDIPIVEIADANAKLDGGDILFTGKEFFVGLSQWTNEAGAKAVAAAYPEYPCVPIKVADAHHLKYFVSLAGPELLCCSSSAASQEILRRIAREATFTYQTLTLTEEDAANVMFINGSIVHRAESEIPFGSQILREKIDTPLHALPFGELAKVATTGLTSCCVLLRRAKCIRNL